MMLNGFRIKEQGRGNVLSNAQVKRLSLDALLSRNPAVGSSVGKDYIVPLVTLKANDERFVIIERTIQAFRDAGFLDDNLVDALYNASMAFESADPPEAVYVYASGRMLNHTLIHYNQKPQLDIGEDENQKPTYSPNSHKILKSNGGTIGGTYGQCVFYHPFAWRYMYEAREKVLFTWGASYTGYIRGEDTYGSIAVHTEEGYDYSDWFFFGFAPFVQADKQSGEYIGDWSPLINPALDVKRAFQHNYGDNYLSVKFAQARHGIWDLPFSQGTLKFNLDNNGVTVLNTVLDEPIDFVPVFAGDSNQGLGNYTIATVEVNGEQRRILLTEAKTCLKLEDMQRAGLKEPWLRSTSELAGGGIVQFGEVKKFVSENIVPPHKTAEQFWEDLYRNMLYKGIFECGEYSDGRTGACGVVYKCEAQNISVQDDAHYCRTSERIMLGRWDGLATPTIFKADISALYNLLYNEFTDVGVTVAESRELLLRGICDSFHQYSHASIKVKVKLNVSPNWRILTDDEIRARIQGETTLRGVVYTDATNIVTELPLEGGDIDISQMLKQAGIDVEKDDVNTMMDKLTKGFDFTIEPWDGSYISIGDTPKLIVESWRE